MSLTVPEHVRSGFLEEGLAGSIPFGTAPSGAGDELNVIAAFKLSVIQPRDLAVANFINPYVDSFEVKTDRIDWIIRDSEDNLIIDTSNHEHFIINNFDDYTYGWVLTNDGTYLCYVAYTTGLVDVVGVYNYAAVIAPFCYELIPTQVTKITAVGYELSESTEWKTGYPQWPSEIPYSALEDDDDLGFPDDGQIEYMGEYSDPGSGQLVAYVDKEVGWPEDAYPQGAVLGSWSLVGEVVFIEGYNMDLTDDYNQSNVYFIANPGAGLGYGPDCYVETEYIHTINNQGPDANGNINIGANNCISITRPGEFEDPLNTIYYYSRSSNHLHIRGDCDICCSCEDFEAVYRALRLLNLRMIGYSIGETSYDGLGVRVENIYQEYQGWRTNFINEQTCRIEEYIQISQVYGHSGYFVSVQVYAQNNKKCAVAQTSDDDMGRMTIRLTKHNDSAPETLIVKPIEGSFWRYSDREGGNPESISLDPHGSSNQDGLFSLNSNPSADEAHAILNIDLRELGNDKNNKLMPGRYIMWTTLWYVTDYERYDLASADPPQAITVITTTTLPNGDGTVTHLHNENDLVLIPTENLSLDDAP